MTAADYIAHWEGCRLKAYQDVRGVWTIGFGCTGSEVKEGLVWSQEQAEWELNKRVARVLHILDAMVEVPLTDNQKVALASFAYNCGLEAFEHSTMLRKLNAGDYQGAASEFLSWDHAAGRVVPGLFNRRMAEKKLFLTPPELT